MIWCFYFIVSVCGGKGALLVTWVEEGANCPGKILTDEMTTINNIRSTLFAITVYETYFYCTTAATGADGALR